MRQLLRLSIAASLALWSASALANENECRLADVLFGKVRVELLPHAGYSTGIVFGNDFDSKRFGYGDILGMIEAPERDGSQAIRDVKQRICGTLRPDGSIVIEEFYCASCDRKAKIRLQKIGKEAFAVMVDGAPMGSIEGRLPK